MSFASASLPRICLGDWPVGMLAEECAQKHLRAPIIGVYELVRFCFTFENSTSPMEASMADELLEDNHNAALSVDCATEAAKQIPSDSELNLDELENVSGGGYVNFIIGMTNASVGIGRYFYNLTND